MISASEELFRQPLPYGRGSVSSSRDHNALQSRDRKGAVTPRIISHVPRLGGGRWIAPLGFLLASAAAHEPITTKLTWTQEISRIVYKHCASCHREGGRSFSLISYDDARPWAKAIRDEVLARRMPPWGAVQGVGEFRNDPSLTPPELDMIVSWVEGGAPKGDDIYLPPVPPAAPAQAKPEAGLREIPVRGSLTLDRTLSLAAIRPSAPMEVTAYLPNGAVRHLIWLRDFHHLTYYFRDPVPLPKGSKVMVFSDTLGAMAFLEEFLL